MSPSLPRILKQIALFKTIWFNFRYFPFGTALRFPVVVCRRTKFFKMKGRLRIEAPVKTFMVFIGLKSLSTSDRLSNTIWDVSGEVVVKGRTVFGQGSKISVGEEASMVLGNNFMTVGDCKLICHKGLVFGSDCIVSWDVLVMDTDFHHIFDENGELANAPAPISVGNHVWIGCRSTLLKRISIADNCVVSASSLITRSFTEPDCIIGGQGKNASVLKRGISWSDKLFR